MARNRMSVHAGFDCTELLVRSDDDPDPISAVVLMRDGEWDGGVVVISDPDIMREFVSWAQVSGFLTDGRGVTTPRHGFGTHEAVDGARVSDAG
jgi:hypothetical protein